MTPPQISIDTTNGNSDGPTGTVSECTSPVLDIKQPTRRLTSELEGETARTQSQMQKWWDEAISRNMGVHNGYKKVAVLIVKWEKELDQLKVDEEVGQLRDVFEKKFNYTTETVELGVNKAQERLEYAVLGFILHHDDPQNLLIIYYAGHGIYHDEKKLLQLAGTNLDSLRGIKLPTVYWSDAEQHFARPARTADVLAIMDCCFASNIVRGGGAAPHSRAFELLAASHIDQVTERPGAHSFTTALVRALHALADRMAAEEEESGGVGGGGSFDTHDLREEINKIRFDNPAELWRRLAGNTRHIRLRRQPPPPPVPSPPPPPAAVPLPASADTAAATQTQPDEPPGGLLSLQFVLSRQPPSSGGLTRETVEQLTRHLPDCFAGCGAPLRNIKWLGYGCGPGRAKTLAEIVRAVMRNNGGGDGGRKRKRVEEGGGVEGESEWEGKEDRDVGLQGKLVVSGADEAQQKDSGSGNGDTSSKRPRIQVSEEEVDGKGLMGTQ